LKYLADRSEDPAPEDEDETPDRHERCRHDQERRRGSAVRTRQYRKRHRTIIARFTARVGSYVRGTVVLLQSRSSP
jgi:hypothetical protein